MPLYVNLEKKHVDKWIREIREKVSDTHLVYEIVYWYLDEYSCVNVKRNAPWFESVIDIITEAWKIVEKEREHGFEHRAPKMRVKKIAETPLPIAEDFLNDKKIKVVKLGA